LFVLSRSKVLKTFEIIESKVHTPAEKGRGWGNSYQLKIKTAKATMEEVTQYRITPKYYKNISLIIFNNNK
jgi:hypothetical protein